IPQTQKDKLYNTVQRAKRMGRVLTVPFTPEATRIPMNQIPALKVLLDDPQLMKLRDDPTIVFLVLGFADVPGRDERSLSISQSRADSVAQAMRDKCGVVNVTHPVALGNSTLDDAENLGKFRGVEVWVVVP